MDNLQGEDGEMMWSSRLNCFSNILKNWFKNIIQIAW
jgi:hypothetical protein